MNCNAPTNSRRRLFWATQPDACGTNEVCGANCGSPGLSFTGEANQPRSILTSDWLRGLIINMLMTDGRNADQPCGYQPGSQGGHWSESYITDGVGLVGTLMRTVGAKGTTAESISLIRAYAVSTLERLVQRGVASSVEVEAAYVGNGKMSLTAVVYGRGDGAVRVGLSGARLQNGWVWN